MQLILVPAIITLAVTLLRLAGGAQVVGDLLGEDGGLLGSTSTKPPDAA